MNEGFVNFQAIKHKSTLISRIDQPVMLGRFQIMRNWWVLVKDKCRVKFES